MSFTDEDLKRLKDRLEHEDCHQTETLWELAPLLARLEAAESALKQVQMGEVIDWEPFNSAYHAWRKASGK